MATPALRQPAAPAAPAAPAKPAAPAAPAPAAKPGAPKPGAAALAPQAPAPGTPGAPAAKPAAPSALDDDPGELGADPGADPIAPPAAHIWPDDWRDQLAGGDAKLLKRLQRYGSPQAVSNALFAAQNRISSGELRPSLPENASAEDLAAWRTEAGIPLKPGDYPMPDGIVFGEDDKTFLESYLKNAHAHNFHPDQVKADLAWYHGDREAQIEALVAQDDKHRVETIEEMTAKWGHEAKRNKAMVNALLDEAPPEVAERIRGARGPEERTLLNDFGVIEWLHNLAFKINPVSTVVPGTTGDIGMAIDDEIAKWEGQMGDRKSEYWGGPTANKAQGEKNQARLRELYAARDRIQQKK